MSRIAVLGASGFLGRRIVAQLATAGHEVIAGTRYVCDVPGAVRQVAGTFTSPEDCQSLLEGCHSIVHAASVSTPGTSAGKPLQEVEGNLRVTAALLEALQAQLETRLVYISSGGSIYADASGRQSDERALVRPRSYHGAGKLASEWLISAWCDQFESRAIAIRPSNIYGPGQMAKPGFGIIPAAFNAALDGSSLTIWGDGTATRDYIYVDDVVNLVIRALAAPLDPTMLVINACSSVSASLNELLDTIQQVAGRPVRREYIAGRNIDAEHIAMNNQRAQQLFAWAPGTSLLDGLATTWAAASGQARHAHA